jgi:two-component system sensor histidine kinase/response regulator
LIRHDHDALKVAGSAALDRRVPVALSPELNDSSSETELLRLTALLRESESFYHSLVESLPQNIFRKDLTGRFTFANSRFCFSVNRQLDEIIGKTDADLFPAEHAAKYRADDLAVIKNRKGIEIVEKHQTPQGLLYVHVIKTPVLDPEGNVIGIQGMFWDETDRYKAQEALEHERDLLRALMENIPDRVYFKDTQSRFICISDAFAERVGMKSPQEAVGKTDADIFTPEHAEASLQDERQILQSGEPIIGKVEREIWPDGSLTWCLTTKLPWRNREGVIRGTFGISRDITDLKRAEKQISEARDQAVESARLKSEFLANMSHEIRTPMNAIIGMTGLMLDTDLSADQKDFAETIRLSADALLGIINDILDFSKIEAGKLAVEEIDFDLNELVEGAADLLADRAQKKEIELAAWIHDEVPRQLRGDPGRLRQVITNLLGNAVKFTEKGEVVLDVSLTETQADRAVVRFTVRDTGIGIPIEAQSRIFEAFTQADGSMTRRYGGTGLGLAITRQLVELMKGEISFASEVGKGSTFWFEIPLPFSKHTKTDRIRKEGALENCRVLIVDDNATNRDILRRQTASRRMRNECAPGAVEALALMRKAVAANDPFKVVLLDMQMPGVDGINLANQIKTEPALASAHLIMLTSLGHLPSERLWKEVGISAYLVKPVKQSRLFDVIAQVLREAPSAAASAKAADKPASAKPINKATIRLLLAEDNPVNQKVALRQLSKLGYNVDAVNNGAEAVKAIERNLYPLILMDCQMPEMDGYKATGRIREMEAASPFRWMHRPYIIAMTANALTGDREACLAAGMDDYISKPVRIEELDAALQRGFTSMETGSAQPNSPAPSPEGPLVDSESLDNLRSLRMEGEPDPLAELVDLFLNDTPDRLAQMRDALQRADAMALESAAHSLKGSASNLGARVIANHCAKVMQCSRKNELAPAAALVKQIEEGFPKVKAILLDEVRR